MKASELVSEITEWIKTNGDKPVVVVYDRGSASAEVQGCEFIGKHNEPMDELEIWTNQ